MNYFWIFPVFPVLELSLSLPFGSDSVVFSKTTKVCVLLKVTSFPCCLQDKMKMPSPVRCLPSSQPPPAGLSLSDLAASPSGTPRGAASCAGSPPTFLVDQLPVPHPYWSKGSFRPFCSPTTSCSLFWLLWEHTTWTFCADPLSSALFC